MLFCIISLFEAKSISHVSTHDITYVVFFISDTVYVQGNLYVTPEDTKHYPTRFFYKQECFESNVEEVSSMSNVVGKCAILNLRDYQYSK